jgi:hypothetical protein
VIARINKIKLKAEPALHLLNVCKLLRAERDKERDLTSQKEQETDTISDLQVRFFMRLYKSKLYNLTKANYIIYDINCLS